MGVLARLMQAEVNPRPRVGPVLQGQAACLLRHLDQTLVDQIPMAQHMHEQTCTVLRSNMAADDAEDTESVATDAMWSDAEWDRLHQGMQDALSPHTPSQEGPQQMSEHVEPPKGVPSPSDWEGRREPSVERSLRGQRYHGQPDDVPNVTPPSWGASGWV